MAVSLEDLSLVVGAGEGGEEGEGCLRCREQLQLAGELGKALLADNRLLQQDAQELKDVIEGLKEEREQLSRQHRDELHSVRTSCNQENLQLQDQVTELAQQLLSSQHHGEEQQREGERRTRELRERVEELQNQIEKLETERQLTPPPDTDRNHSNEEFRINEKRLEELQSQLFSLQEDRESDCARMARLEAELAESRCREAAVEAELDRVSVLLESREYEVQDLSLHLEEAQRALSDLHLERQGSEQYRPVSTSSPRSGVLESTGGESLHEELMRICDHGNGCQVVGDVFSLSGHAPIESFQTCQSCEDLRDEIQKLKQECECMAKQMLALVRQKFDMAQQIDQWQSDMEVMVKDSILRQLKGEDREVTPPPQPQTTPPTSTTKSWAGRLLSMFS